MTIRPTIATLFVYPVMDYNGCTAFFNAEQEYSPRYDVFHGDQWIGCTNAVNEASWRAAVRHIADWHMKWHESTYGQTEEKSINKDQEI